MSVHVFSVTHYTRIRSHNVGRDVCNLPNSQFYIKDIRFAVKAKRILQLLEHASN